MKKSVKIRLIIFKILLEIYKKSSNFESSYNKITKNTNISTNDRSLINNVCLNSLRLQFHINQILNSFLTKKPKINQYILLLNAVTQLIYLNFKDYAVIDDSVEISKKINVNPGLINGVLRNILRNKNKLEGKKVDYNALPKWFVKNSKNLNQKNKDDFVKTFFKEPNLHIVFKNKHLLKNFKNKHFISTTTSAFILESKKVKDLYNYKQGDWWVQDFSSMLPIYLSSEISKKKILDLCAAPGGKLFQEILKGSKVHANDINENKIEILKNNLKRLKINSKITNKNALKLELKEKYDVIIIDAPCTSVGTIRRNPEIFFKKNPPNIISLVNLQRKLMDKASLLLNKNGIIIYMVCSFLYEETEAQIDYFLKIHKNFSLLKFSKIENEKNINNFINNKGYILHVPKTYKNFLIDGFFAVKFIKNV